jgi:uncharacterized protein YkwD
MNRRALLSLFILVSLAAGASHLLAADGAASSEANKVYQQALSKLNAGDQAAALAGFKRAAQMAPGWGAPNARLGVIYQLQGKEEEAREQYRLAQAACLPEVNGQSSSQRTEIIANEAYLVYLVNEARLREGQSALVPDPTVSVVARRHSEEMRDKRYFDHASPTAGLANVQERFRAVFGYKPRCVGENVARRWGTEYCLKPEKILKSHNDLMASTGHRKNLLYPTFEWLGVGIAANANGDYWITQVFVESGR